MFIFEVFQNFGSLYFKLVMVLWGFSWFAIDECPPLVVTAKTEA
jgi:hypothetical protein